MGQSGSGDDLDLRPRITMVRTTIGTTDTKTIPTSTMSMYRETKSVTPGN